MTTPHYTAYMEGTLRLSAAGEWQHEGTAFTHPELAKLFHRSIVWDEPSRAYVVKIGNGIAHFTCEDTAYFVAEIRDDTAPWQVVLFDGSSEPLDPTSIVVGNAHQIYCAVKGGHRARLSRPAHQHLMRYARSDTELEIAGSIVPLRKS